MSRHQVIYVVRPTPISEQTDLMSRLSVTSAGFARCSTVSKAMKAAAIQEKMRPLHRAPRGRAVSTAMVAMGVSLVGVHQGVERARRKSTKPSRAAHPPFPAFPPPPPPPRPPPPP